MYGKGIRIRGINFETELVIPIEYKGLELDANLRCDLFVENELVVELKALEKVLSIHEAQVLSYMNLLNVSMGLIINFNVTNIYKEGQKTYVNHNYRLLED